MAQGQGRRPGEVNRKAKMRGSGGGGKKGDVKARDLLQPAFKEGLEFEVPSEVEGIISRFMSGDTSTFEKTPEQRAAQFQTEIKDPALRTFFQEVVPELNQRFVSRGVRGPAQEASLLQAGGDLSTNLAALQSGFLRQDEGLRMQSEENVLGRQSQGVSAALGTQLLPIQLKSFLGGQAKGIEQTDSLNAFVQNLLTQQQDIGGQLQGAIQNAFRPPVQQFSNLSSGGSGGGFLGLF